MFKAKIHIILVTCISILISNEIVAQSDNLAILDSNTCPNNFVPNNEFDLCATNAFDKPSFKKLNVNQRCATGYARLANSRLCLLDNKRVRLRFKQGQLRIIKGPDQKCGSNYIRLPSHKACVHKRVGLTTINSKLTLVQTAKLTCDARNPESSSCKSKCATGFFRSPELGFCVDYNASLQSNTLLSTADCKNPLHWKKLENSGVCVPRMVLSIVRNPAGQFVLEPNENDLPNCQGGAQIQVTNMTLNTNTNAPEVQPLITGENVQASNSAGAQEFGIQPVISCMVRPRPPR